MTQSPSPVVMFKPWSVSDLHALTHKKTTAIKKTNKKEDSLQDWELRQHLHQNVSYKF